jgi:hypothetical protein
MLNRATDLSAIISARAGLPVKPFTDLLNSFISAVAKLSTGTIERTPVVTSRTGVTSETSNEAAEPGPESARIEKNRRGRTIVKEWILFPVQSKVAI